MDVQAVTDTLLALDQAVIMDIFWTMIPFILLPIALVLIFLSYRMRLAQYILLDHPRVGSIFALMCSFRMMKKQGWKLFWLDLRLGWYYVLNLLLAMLCYGELLLPLVGVSAEGGMLLTFLFYALALVGQLGLYVWQKPQVMTAYALFYEALLPKDEAKTEEI
jgi:uncharacterized membrane protein